MKIGIECSEEEMKKSIIDKLFTLQRETMVLPGHGPLTSIATEYLYNPVIGQIVKKSCVCWFSFVVC